MVSKALTLAIMAYFLPGSEAGCQWGHVPVKKHNLRYCKKRNWIGSCTERGYPLGTYWEDAGMGNDHQDKAVVGIVGYHLNVPSGSNVEYIVITSAGQQGGSGGAEYASNVAGAFPNYGLNGNQAYENGYVNCASVAGRLWYADTQAKRDKTLYLSVHNTMFNHMMWSDEKSDILDGWKNYLAAKTSNFVNVKGITLAGYSRGGALTMRLAQTLMSSYPNQLASTTFAIGVLDGVAKKSQNELTTGSVDDNIDNPVSSNSNYWTRGVRFNQIIPTSFHAQTCIHNIAAGETVIWASGVHAFSEKACDGYDECVMSVSGSTTVAEDISNNQDYLTTYNDWMLHEKWVNIDHASMGELYTTTVTQQCIDPIFDHLRYCGSRFGWEGHAPLTPAPTPAPEPAPAPAPAPIYKDPIKAISLTPAPTPAPITKLEPSRLEPSRLEPSP